MTEDVHPHTAHIVIDGAPRPLRLTLGALAEIEAAFGGQGFDAIVARLKAPGAGDILIILEALLRGGGAGLSREALMASDIDLATAAQAIAAAFGGLAPDAEEEDTAQTGAPGKRDAGAQADRETAGAPSGATPSSAP